MMRFFTPDLYMRFNSSNDDEADRADAAWEDAIRAYRKQLDESANRFPSQVRKLAAKHLHDAELLGLSDEAQSLGFGASPDASSSIPLWSAVAVLSVESEGKAVSLIYSLWDRTSRHPAPDDWPMSKDRVHWLYDEIERVSEPGSAYLHKVLFSDGTVLEVPFVSVLIHEFFLPKSSPKRQTRATA